MRMQYRVVANDDAVSHENVRVNLYVVAHADVVADIRECATVNIFTGYKMLTCIARLFDTGLLETDQLVIFFQQRTETHIGVVYENKRSGDGFARHEIPVDDHGRRMRRVDIL